MNIKDYQSLAMHTTVKSLDSRAEGMLHAAIGMGGKVGEFADLIFNFIIKDDVLDVNHADEELGYVCWHIALMCEAVGFRFDELQQPLSTYAARLNVRYDSPEEEFHKIYSMSAFYVLLSAHVGEIQNITRNHYYFGHTIKWSELKMELENAMTVINIIAGAYLKSSLDMILEDNIDKLQKLYPEKFTEKGN